MTFRPSSSRCTATPGARREPVPPALLAMAVLLQAYEGMSDAAAVEMTVVDLRWQMVLDCLGSEQPAFGQGALRFSCSADPSRHGPAFAGAHRRACSHDEGVRLQEAAKTLRSRSIPARAKAPGASRTRSICWATPRGR